MLSKGNANPAICANNLARISRGEVVYDRIQGVKFADLIGSGVDAQKEIAYSGSGDLLSVATTDAALGNVSVRVDLAEG